MTARPEAPVASGAGTRLAKPILLIEDDATLNRLIKTQLGRAGYDVRGVLRASDALRFITEEEPALILLDIRLPDRDGLELLQELRQICPVILLTAHGAIHQAVAALKLGAHDYLTKPIRPEELEVAIERALDHAQLKRSGDFLKDRLQSLTTATMVGASKVFNEVRRQIGLFGPTDATILILGESGVGKELVARAIHDSSMRSDESYVAVDCSTLHENLFESELFGHERGSFTGADRRKLGLVEVADGGTVFLDEIGELSLALQAKLLRVLESGTFRRVGGVTDLKANVRFIAATNRDLVAMGGDGKFRMDLYYRLSRFVLTVPPLRDRGDDAAEIARHFVRTRNFHRSVDKTLNDEAVAAIRAYRWPGNVRELKNVVERAVLLSGAEPEIGAIDLGLRAEHGGRSEASIGFNFDHLPTMEELQTRYVEMLLDRGTFSRAKIADSLGISERTVYRILQSRKRK
jgi:DNA-binding NtrC family response regulator